MVIPGAASSCKIATGLILFITLACIYVCKHICMYVRVYIFITLIVSFALIASINN